MKAQVIDLFAGPGGLGEGFFSFPSEGGSFPFESLISVEKDSYAHATLTLRAFYRELMNNGIQIPQTYFDYVDGIAISPADECTEPYWRKAQSETLLLELGKDPKFDKKLFTALKKENKKSKNSMPLILIGGPPCQAYSLVGRARNKGNTNYIAEEDHRHFLYKEYLNIMSQFEPDIFVMENVKGLLSSKVGGGAVFERIVSDLKGCGKGYSLFSLKTGQKFEPSISDPRDFILRSEDYGVPQNRHRVIILGIKNSKLNSKRVPALEKVSQVTVGDVISDLPELRSPLSGRGEKFPEDSLKNWKKNLEIGVKGLIRNSSLPKELVSKLQEELKKALNSNLNTSVEDVFKKSASNSSTINFINDFSGQCIRNHQARPHMDTDLIRYFYCSAFQKVYGKNAKAQDFPECLAPKHKNWNSGKFVDRFKVQGYASQSSTVTSHISKDGHYFIHSAPYQCRSLTVREAARLQSFPDSYQFMGKRTNQYHQVGNAVPPYLARQIAKIVYKILKAQVGEF